MDEIGWESRSTVGFCIIHIEPFGSVSQVKSVIWCWVLDDRILQFSTSGGSSFTRSVAIISSICLFVSWSDTRKGKSVPLQAWSGPEGSRKLRFPDFMTTAQDGGKVVSLKHRPPLPPGNAPGIHFC